MDKHPQGSAYRTDVSYKAVDVGVGIADMNAELFRMAERGYEFVMAVPITSLGNTTGYRLVFLRRDRIANVNPSTDE